MSRFSDSDAPVPPALLPGSPLEQQATSMKSPSGAGGGGGGAADGSLLPGTASRLRSQTMAPTTSTGLPATSSTAGVADPKAREHRSASVDAETIEIYSQLVSDDVKNLQRLRKASVVAFGSKGDAAAAAGGKGGGDGDGNATVAGGPSGKRWGVLRTVARSTFAISKDLKALKNMVGMVSGQSLTTQEMELKLLNDELSRQKGVIMPETTFRFIWDSLQVVLLLYVALIVPYRFGFSVVATGGSTSWWWEVFVDLYFVGDVILNFYFAYEDEDEVCGCLCVFGCFRLAAVRVLTIDGAVLLAICSARSSLTENRSDGRTCGMPFLCLRPFVSASLSLVAFFCLRTN